MKTWNDYKEHIKAVDPITLRTGFELSRLESNQ